MVMVVFMFAMGQAYRAQSAVMMATMGTSPKPWFLYLIECADRSIYTGIAVDVAARFAAHAAGKGARYTRAHPPVRLLASVAFPDRSAASREEYRVKQLTPAEKRRFAQMHGQAKDDRPA
jgi:putative endonuclease